MGKTIVDMPKVTQMLDAGWQLHCFKNQMGSYTVRAFHPKGDVRRRTAKALKEFFAKNASPGLTYIKDADWEGNQVETDDFTPEQAMTRMAYKVHGEILL